MFSSTDTLITIDEWKTYCLDNKCCLLYEDVHRLYSSYAHYRSIPSRYSLSIGEDLPQSISTSISTWDQLHYTMVGRLKSDLLILRSDGLDVTFVLAEVKVNKVSLIRRIPWPLDLFRSMIGCIIPGPGEMDFMVRVSCNQNYAVIVGPETDKKRATGIPRVQLVTRDWDREINIQDDTANGWPANLAFHPRLDNILAVLHSTTNNPHCPWPRFCYTPVKLLLYDVRRLEVLCVLDDTPLAPQLLNFTNDGNEIMVLTHMKVKNYAVESVKDGNTSDLLWVSADGITDDELTCNDVPDDSPITLKVKDCRCSLQVVSRVNASNLCEWNHKETADHVHKSLSISAISSLDRKTAHVMPYSTLYPGDTRVYRYRRDVSRHYIDDLLRLCRTSVLKYTSIRDIHKLPLPQALKQYLMGGEGLTLQSDDI